MGKSIATVCVALAIVACSVPTVALAGPGPGGGGGGGQQQLKAQGIIVGVNPVTGQVAIALRNGQTIFVVAGPTTKIERNGVRVSLYAFKLGDRGQALFAPNGAASKIEAIGL